MTGVGKKEEGTGHQGRIQNIHSCSTKYLFPDYHGKNCGHGYHPEWYICRHHQRDQHSGDKITFSYLFISHLRKGNLNSQSYHIAYNNNG